MQRVQLKKLGRRVQKGFTLIELMIVVAIIGILAAIAIPQYQKYAAKAKYTEVIQATGPYKVAVEQCYQAGNPLVGAAAAGAVPATGCDQPGNNGVPANVTVTSGNVATVAVTAGGVITATAVNAGGLAGEQYIMTPAASGAGSSSALTWTISGSCKGAGYC